MPKRVIAKLKSDIESTGEITLALRELARLCGDVSVRTADSHEVETWTEINTAESKSLFLVTEVDSLPNLNTRLDRLAYADWYVCGDLRREVPQQAQLESLASEAAGRIKASRRDREYLSHGIHKYKAKFFPRFARALINICSPELDATVLDPFCGSGTTGLEAGLIGLRPICSDIDPLSCLISQAKVRFPLVPLSEIDLVERAVNLRGVSAQAELFESLPRAPYKIPNFLRTKLAPEVASEIESDMSTLVTRVASMPSQSTRSLAGLMISHAISTKISLRWVGTGDNRFAVELAARDIFSIISSQVKRLRSNHPEAIGYRLPLTAIEGLSGARFKNTSADTIELPDDSVDSVVTSPPYLPASSGRETYLRSRAPGLVALELLSEDQIHELDATEVVGSVLRKSGGTENGYLLPDAAIQLVEWMRPQRARGPKSDATLVYFRDLGRIAKEMHRVLRPGGLMAMVVCTSHSFYELVSREVVRRFPLAQILAEYFTEPQYGIGFESVEPIEIELPKMDYNARPGSRHKYSETALIFKKQS